VFQNYGLIGLSAVLAFTAFQFVVSIPMGPFIVVLGGLASQGFIHVAALWCAVFIGQVIGDNIGFALGRKFGRPLLHRFGMKFVQKSAIEKAERTFTRYGAIAVFFTRFILATIAAPLNILAGASALSWRRFLLADVGGQLVWSSLYVFLGYFFGPQLGEIIRLVDRANVTAISVFMFAVVIFVLWLYSRAIKHHVRMHRKHQVG
jgi:membrane protein DedA with SNARE-associated domain